MGILESLGNTLNSQDFQSSLITNLVTGGAGLLANKADNDAKNEGALNQIKAQGENSLAVQSQKDAAELERLEQQLEQQLQAVREQKAATLGAAAISANASTQNNTKSNLVKALLEGGALEVNALQGLGNVGALIK